MKIFFYALLLSALFFNIPSYAVNGYNAYTLRHHNGLLAQGTNTAQPINPSISIPYYFSNSYGYNNYFSELEMIIAFTLIVNDGSYGNFVPQQ